MGKVVSFNEEPAHKKRVDKAKAKLPALKKELKEADYKNESLVVKKLNLIARRLDKMIKVGYENYLEKPGFGNSNSFVSLVNSLQNVIANIRQLRNTEEQVDYIVDKIITKAFTTAILQLSAALVTFKEDLKPRKKGQLESALKAYGEFLTAQVEEIRTKLTEYMGV